MPARFRLSDLASQSKTGTCPIRKDDSAVTEDTDALERNIVPTCFFVVSALASQGQVKRDGMDSTVKIESTVAGHLSDLNGKYKLRASESVYQPGGMIGEHHHAGPGIRYVKSGTLRYVQGEKTTIYRGGDYFYETGDVTHTAYNDTDTPVVVINFEILPVDWKGGSAIPPPR